MSTLERCEKFFGKKDLYDVLEISKDAEPSTIKKAYYKISLLVHPDRVEEDEKKEATEKFKIISKAYQILTDKDKRALYDERGIVDDDDEDDEEVVRSKLINWLELWRKLFQPITLDAISNYEASYINSELERADIKKSYLFSKGDINVMINQVPFLKVEDEPRLHKIVQEMIDANEVPEFKEFTEEKASKRKRRHRKYARESEMAEKIKEEHVKRNEKNETSGMDDLATALLERGKARASNFDSLMDKLTEMCGDDDSEGIEISSLGKKRKSAKKKTAKEDLRKVRSGKIQKRKN